MIKFIDLLGSENENTLSKLVTYIHKGITKIFFPSLTFFIYLFIYL